MRKKTSASKIMAAKQHASLFHVYCFPLDFMNGSSEEYRGGEVIRFEERDHDCVMIVFKNDAKDLELRRISAGDRSHPDHGFQHRLFGPVAKSKPHLWYEPVTPALQARVDAMLEMVDA